MGYKEILLQRKLAEADNAEPQEKKKKPELNIIQDISNTREFFGIESINGFPTCLDLRLSNGNSVALPYTYIVEIKLSPSEGIEITTAGKKIVVEGRNLQALYNHLLAYKVKYIQANIGNDLTEDKELFIKAINIEEV